MHIAFDSLSNIAVQNVGGLINNYFLAHGFLGYNKQCHVVGPQEPHDPYTSRDCSNGLEYNDKPIEYVVNVPFSGLLDLNSIQYRAW